MKYINNLAVRITPLILCTCLTACESSSDDDELANDVVVDVQTENSAAIIDPNSLLSQLEFETAEHQASYECVLSTATETAIAADMQAIPAWWQDNPTFGLRWSVQTWCNVPGHNSVNILGSNSGNNSGNILGSSSGNNSDDSLDISSLVDADLERCETGNVGGMQAPGTHALAVVTEHFGAQQPAGTMVYLSKKILETGTQGWVLSFTKRVGLSVPSLQELNFNFKRFDGTELIGEAVSLRHPYVFRDDEFGIREFVSTSRSINEYLTDYRVSGSQFNATVQSYLSAVELEVEAAIRARDDLSEEDTTLVLTRLNTEINQTKAFFEANQQELYTSLLTAPQYVDCEGM